MTTYTEHEGLKAQDALIEKLEREHFNWDLLVGDAFVRGMRDIGYKSTPYAVGEIVDNALQAEAQHIDIAFGFEGGSVKPTSLAIIDDGHGMQAKMVRASLIWGAGTRIHNKAGMGKYGYGLPSASVSQCKLVTVFSKVANGDWYGARLDIKAIEDGTWSENGRIAIPKEERADLPPFVVEYLKAAKRWESFEHGTVVLWETLDRTDFKLHKETKNQLLNDLGIMYRNFLPGHPMTVDATNVEPCDPLFLTPGFRLYDLDDDHGIPLDPAVVEVKDKETKEVIGTMRIRYSRLPATFFRKPEAKKHHKVAPSLVHEPRVKVAEANSGIIFMREGRQIDVVKPPRGFGLSTITTLDRFWGVEVDFDASLDRFFSITTSKQQVRPHEKVWVYLRDEAKVFTAISGMKAIYSKEAEAIRAAVEKDPKKKPASVEAIEEGSKFRSTKPPVETPKRKEEAKSNLVKTAKTRAQKAGVAPEVVERELEAQRQGQMHTVESEDVEGGAFFRCVQEGGTCVLYINSAHPFYSELYAGHDSNPRLRAGLEILLWALGEAEVDADPDSERRQFYVSERRSVWTTYLANALTVLKRMPVVVEADEANQADESAA